MTKEFYINWHVVEFTECTAIAASVDDTVRRKALFVHDRDDEFGDGDGVIFDVDLPETESEAKSLMYEYLDTYSETLETVVFA